MKVGWIRRQTDEEYAQQRHECEMPVREEVRTGAIRILKPRFVPDGLVGDLWRCPSCCQLWRIGYLCVDCDRNRGHDCDLSGREWHKARWWQRIRYLGHAGWDVW